MSRVPGNIDTSSSRRPTVRFLTLGAIVAIVLIVLVVVWGVFGPLTLRLGSTTGTPVVTMAGGPPQLVGNVTAGPVCPVEASSPDPRCAPRPVPGAVIVVTDTTGQELGRATTGPDGSYSMYVGQTGTIVVTALPVDGLPGTPSPVSITLPAPSTINRVDLLFDTGIR